MLKLNPQQQEAVDSNERTILCLAAAGCGKTKTLLARIERLIKDGVNPKTILALTFTNAAAFEMKERYKQLPGIDLSKGTPEFRTFHSFCYSLIIKDKAVRSRLGYSKIPSICDDNKLKEIKTEVKLAIGCKLSDAALENDAILSRQEQEEKAVFQKAFKKHIKKENLITFDMMCYNVSELFIKHDECIEKYRDFYTCIFCDEMQDNDRNQFKFLGSFPETCNFFFVGDVLQSIYSFRGTSNEFIKQLVVTPGWKVIKMYTNYRSTRQICDFANKFSTYSKDEYRIEMEGLRDGEKPEVIYGSNSSYANPVDTDHLSILIDKLNENKSECAILCRTNKECAAVRSALTDAGIQFSSSNKTTDNVDLVKSALSNAYMLEWLSTKLDTTAYADYIRLAATAENPDIRWFLGLYRNNRNVKPSAEKVVAIRNITASKASPKEKFEEITKILRVKTKCTFEGDDTWINAQIVHSILDQVTELAESKIYVGTIHSSKGLEYDSVYLMGVNDTMFRLGTEDMNNLLYVGMTRAKNHLTIFRR